MDTYIGPLLADLPIMVLHTSVIVALLVGGIFLYIKLTPYDDMRLVREGNVAAGISLFSIIVGLSLPLAFCLAVGSSLAELVFWGAFTVAIQLLAFKLCDWLLRDLPERIEQGEVSAALVLLGFKLAAAFINSAMG